MSSDQPPSSFHFVFEGILFLPGWKIWKNILASIAIINFIAIIIFQGRSDAKLQKEISAKNQTYCPISIYLAKFETESFFIFPSGNIFSLGDWFLKIFWKRSINVPSVLEFKNWFIKRFWEKFWLSSNAKTFHEFCYLELEYHLCFGFFGSHLFIFLCMYKSNIALKQVLKKEWLCKKQITPNSI